MGHHAKKLLCYTAITAILNSSIQPLYAGGFNHPKIPKDLSVEEHHQQRPRLLALDDYLQEKVKTSATSIQAWTPEFIKDPLARAYKGLSSWIGEKIKDAAPYILAKTPLEIDYAHDLTYWHAHFKGAIEEIKERGLNKDRLLELQDIVWSGLLSPYQYEKELNALKQQGSRSLLKGIQKTFQTTLETSPELLKVNFVRDLLTSLNTIRSAQRKEEKELEINNFKGILDYYKHRQNPLDYVESLKDAKVFMEVNKRTFSYQSYNDLYKAINRAIRPQDLKHYHALKAKRKLTQTVLQERSSYDEDMPEGRFTSSLPQALKKDTKEEEAFSLTRPIKALGKAVSKGIQYAVEHPLQAMTVGLATQVAAAAAFNTLRVDASKAPKKQPIANPADDFSKEKAQAQKNPSKKAPVPEVPTPLLSSRYNKRGIGNEFQINQNTTLEHYRPCVAELSDGNVFVAWDSIQSVDGDVYGRVFYPNGTALTDEFLINQNITEGQGHPSVAGLNNGKVFVAWDSNQNYGIGIEQTDVYGRIFYDNGTAFNDEFQLAENTIRGQHFPTVTGLNNGNAFVTWTSYYGDGDVSGRIFDENANPLTSEFPINVNTTGIQQYQSIAKLNNENVLVAWNGGQTGDQDIYGRLFSENGTVLSNEFRINQNTTFDQYTPRIAGLVNGNVFVAWRDVYQAGDYDIFGRILSANGTALNDVFSINQNTTGYQYTPSIVSFTNGDTFTIWNGNPNGVYHNLFGRIFFANGTAFGNEFRINEGATAGESNPSIARLTNDNIFMTWQGSRTGNYNIYGRIFTNETIYSMIYPPSTTGTTGIIGTTGRVTTGEITTGTTGRVTTGLNVVTTSLVDSDSSSSPTSSNLPLIIGAAVGGTTLCLGGVPLVYYLYKRSKRLSFQSEPNDNIELEKRASNANPFGPTSLGVITKHSTIFVGALKDRTYAIWEELSEAEAKILQPRIAKKIPHFSSSTDKVRFDLGKGKFGVTYAGSDIKTRNIYAIKEVYGRDVVEESLREGKLQNELKENSQVMSLIDYTYYEPSEVTEQPRLFQVMDLAYTNGVGYKQMTSLLREKDPSLHEKLVSDNFQQLMKGLAFMHDKSIVHLDIKDENILYMRDGTLRIADFGRARKLKTNDQIADNQLGDRRKFSPEQLAFVRSIWKKDGKDVGTGELADSFSAKMADTWAGGAYILELWLNEDSFSNTIVPYATKVLSWTNASFENVLNGVKLLKEATSKSFPDVLRHVLAVDVHKRLEPGKAVKKLASFNMSSEERTKTFEKLIVLNEEIYQQEGRATEASFIGTIDMYFSTMPREENENYKYNSTSPAMNHNATNNNEGNKYHFLPEEKK